MRVIDKNGPSPQIGPFYRSFYVRYGQGSGARLVMPKRLVDILRDQITRQNVWFAGAG
jgi:hypothetical protein